MYTFLLYEQIFSIIIIILGIIMLFYCKRSRLQLIMELLLAGILANQCGYLVEMTATSMDVAMAGVRFAYVGKLLAEFLMFLFVMECCGKKLPVWLSHILLAVHIYVITLVWNYKNTTLYYSSIDYVEDGLFPHLVLGHGIVYQLFTIVTFSYMFIMLATCIVAYIKEKDVAAKGKLRCVFLLPIMSILSLVLFKVNALKGYDSTTLAYTIDAVLLVYAIRKYNLTNPVGIAKDMIIDEFDGAVLVLNADNTIQYSNPLAQKLFGIDENTTKFQLSDESLAILNSLYSFQFDDRIYDISKRIISQKGWADSTLYVLSDRTENHMYTRMLEEKAHIDELTQAYNRRAFISALETNLEADKSYVALLDIDNFKTINDTYGHDVGDECLVLLTMKLQAAFSFEEIFRLGGDEFVVLTSKEDILGRLTSVNEYLQSESNPYPFSISGGYTKYVEGMDDRSIINTADEGLYKKKKSGKGGFVLM